MTRILGEKRVFFTANKERVWLAVDHTVDPRNYHEPKPSALVKLADEFAITQKACETCVGTLLQLDPLVPDARFTRILLEVDPKTAQVLKSTVIDPDGSENSIAFLNLKTNVLPGFDGGSGSVDPRFKLTPPPGTQVQDFTMGVGAQPKP